MADYARSLHSDKAHLVVEPELPLYLSPSCFLAFLAGREDWWVAMALNCRLSLAPCLLLWAFFLFTLPGIGGSYWTTFFPAVVFLGLGMATTIAPLTTAVLGAVEDRYAGIASGINNAVARVAGLLAIAVLSIFVLHTFNSSLDSRMDALHVSPAIRQLLDDQRIKLAAARVPATVQGTLHTALQHAIASSFVDSFRLAMWIGIGLALTSALCAFLLVEGKSAPPKSDASS